MNFSSVIIELVRLMPGGLVEVVDWVACRNWSISGIIPGKKLTSLDARSTDSLKLPTFRMTGRVDSTFEMVRSCVTFSEAEVLERVVTDQATVPLMLVDIGNAALIGQAITLLAAVVVPRVSHDSRKEIVTLRM